MKPILLFLIILFLPELVFAHDTAESIGDVAKNLLEPVYVVGDFVATGSLIIGICSLFAAFLRYTQHRVNPMIAPMSTIVMLIAIGIVLVCLPFIYKLTSSGVPFTIF